MFSVCEFFSSFALECMNGIVLLLIFIVFISNYFFMQEDSLVKFPHSYK